MDDAPSCIDQEHSRGERVETVGQGRGLNSFEIDNLADKNGTADMRYDKCEPATHLVVSEAVR